MTITLEQIEAQHKKTAEMINVFKANLPRSFIIDSATFELATGEHYGGMALNDEGLPSHHVVLLPGEAEDINFENAKVWAAAHGGDLPTPQEQALLYANLKKHFLAALYWSNTEHPTNKSCAFVQSFDYGDQDNGAKSNEFRARAVRRIPV